MMRERNLAGFSYIVLISQDLLSHLIQLDAGQNFVILNLADSMHWKLKKDCLLRLIIRI